MFSTARRESPSFIAALVQSHSQYGPSSPSEIAEGKRRRSRPLLRNIPEASRAAPSTEPSASAGDQTFKFGPA
jgi:hypothetical protein